MSSFAYAVGGGGAGLTPAQESLLNSAIQDSEKGVANGVAPLDSNAQVPLINLPTNLKEIKIVANITARNAIPTVDRFEGLYVLVEDATGDPSVITGWASYVLKSGLTNADWFKTSEGESIDLLLSALNTTYDNTSSLLSATNVQDAIDELQSEKVDKVTGKQLSTEDYSTIEKTKLSGIQDGAEVNVQGDWNQANNTADDYIKNKPTIPTQYTDELAQDAVGNILIDTNTIDLVYDDLNNQIKADLKKQNTSSVNLTEDSSGLKADINFGNTSGTATEGNDARLGTKNIDETNIANNRIQVYNSTTGNLEYQDKPNGVTNLSINNKTATTLDITSDTGTDATIPEATITEAGLLNANDKIKLNNFDNKQNIITVTVNSQAAMLALTNVAVNDIILRTDLGNAQFQLTSLPASNLSNWRQLSVSTPTPVISTTVDGVVNGGSSMPSVDGLYAIKLAPSSGLPIGSVGDILRRSSAVWTVDTTWNSAGASIYNIGDAKTYNKANAGFNTWNVSIAPLVYNVRATGDNSKSGGYTTLQNALNAYEADYGASLGTIGVIQIYDTNLNEIVTWNPSNNAQNLVIIGIGDKYRSFTQVRQIILGQNAHRVTLSKVMGSTTSTLSPFIIQSSGTINENGVADTPRGKIIFDNCSISTNGNVGVDIQSCENFIVASNCDFGNKIVNFADITLDTSKTASQIQAQSATYTGILFKASDTGRYYKANGTTWQIYNVNFSLPIFLYLDNTQNAGINAGINRVVTKNATCTNIIEISRNNNILEYGYVNGILNSDTDYDTVLGLGAAANGYYLTNYTRTKIVSSVNATSNTLGITTHGLSTGDLVSFTATTLPNPIISNKQYIVVKIDNNNISLIDPLISGTPTILDITGTTITSGLCTIFTSGSVLLRLNPNTVIDSLHYNADNTYYDAINQKTYAKKGGIFIEIASGGFSVTQDSATTALNFNSFTTTGITNFTNSSITLTNGPSNVSSAITTTLTLEVYSTANRIEQRLTINNTEYIRSFVSSLWSNWEQIQTIFNKVTWTSHGKTSTDINKVYTSVGSAYTEANFNAGVDSDYYLLIEIIDVNTVVFVPMGKGIVKPANSQAIIGTVLQPFSNFIGQTLYGDINNPGQFVNAPATSGTGYNVPFIVPLVNGLINLVTPIPSPASSASISSIDNSNKKVAINEIVTASVISQLDGTNTNLTYNQIRGTYADGSVSDTASIIYTISNHPFWNTTLGTITNGIPTDLTDYMFGILTASTSPSITNGIVAIPLANWLELTTKPTTAAPGLLTSGKVGVLITGDKLRVYYNNGTIVQVINFIPVGQFRRSGTTFINLVNYAVLANSDSEVINNYGIMPSYGNNSSSTVYSINHNIGGNSNAIAVLKNIIPEMGYVVNDEINIMTGEDSGLWALNIWADRLTAGVSMAYVSAGGVTPFFVQNKVNGGSLAQRNITLANWNLVFKTKRTW